ncbi:hypothetical protein [Sphingosinicella sp. CPCC 101087]|uniref:hypothetical protein n=1 Tax=Sphingosinicella sp. CPCC 101087 TaxID=2497754 RepID=UPI00101B9C05|nr:hypothetical protein [Sphingosinicella sp. CPCC 101087]
MATAVRSRLGAERRFYSFMAIMMIVLMLIGFAPSFFLRGYVSFPRPNPTITPAILLHGIVFTLWMLVFWAQTVLVAAGRRDVHMKLGAAGMALAVLLVPMMYWVAVYQVARANQPPFATPLGWTSVPLATIPVYAILVWQGWKRRRDAQAHKRLMLGAALLFMGPAVGRLPLGPPALVGHAFGQFLAWLCFVPLFWWDLKTLGRLHWATKLGAGLALAAVFVPVLLMATGSWDAVAARLPGV